MSEADGLRAEIDTALYEIAEITNQLAHAEKKIEALNGSLAMFGLLSADRDMLGSIHIGQLLKAQNDISLNFLFELRQRLTLYRDKP